MNNHDAKLGVFVTLNKPTVDMEKAAREAGSVEAGGKLRPRVQIRTIAELFKGNRPDLPPVHDIISAAAAARRSVQRKEPSSQVGRRDKKVAFIQAAHCWWKEEGTEGPALGRAAAYNAARDAAHKTRTPVGDLGRRTYGSRLEDTPARAFSIGSFAVTDSLRYCQRHRCFQQCATDKVEALTISVLAMPIRAAHETRYS